MTETEPISIALAFDDNYWAPAYALMRSICLHSRHPERLHFHLCEYGLTPPRVAQLDKIADEFGASLHHYDVLQSQSFKQFEALLPARGHLHSVIYARMLLDQFVPKSLKRIVYLDCDTMVMAPIEELLAIDLKGHAVGAVRDTQAMRHKLGYDMRAKGDIFDARDDYFNSGVLLIDLDKFRVSDVPGWIVKFESSDIITKLYYDQDMLNLIFRNDWRELEWRYNVIDPAMAHEALQPKILHYTGGSKPWNMFSQVAFASIYRHTMTQKLYFEYMRFRIRQGFLRPFRALAKVIFKR